VGAEGVVRRDGLVAVTGELWRARAEDASPLVPGERVRVVRVEDDLRLVVGSIP
jgi:membrane protein implicated in regulation of membrane protease activity